MISSGIPLRLDTISMIGVAKGNTEGLAWAQSQADEAKARYGRDVEVKEIDFVPDESLGFAQWAYATGSEETDDDGTYSPMAGSSAGSYYELTEPSSTDEASALFEEFKTWADMTPAERIRAQYLEDHNLTEDALAAMPEDEQKPILEAIKDLIEKQLGTTDSAESEIMAMLQTSA